VVDWLWGIGGFIALSIVSFCMIFGLKMIIRDAISDAVGSQIYSLKSDLEEMKNSLNSIDRKTAYPT
jgi:hypothetical protein